ncbi:MAG TPA: hypothetical protein VFE25_00385 [Opitutaceae bacterium]|jgi:hypothetical protein|nr:hypothetical protein [Opitutaceae bacterium]
MRPKIGLIQSRGIGDIVIALPIAKYYSDRGYDVYWPIDQRFAASFRESVDYVNFVPFKFEANAQGFIHLPMELLKKAGCGRCIPLYSYLSGDNTSNKAYFNSLKFDEYKYAVAGVPFGEKWNLSLKRDAAREDSLYRQLVTQEDYVVVHQQGSNFKAKFAVPAPYRKCQVIEIAERTDNILDWLGILEKARLLIMIDSCFSNLVEQLGFENEKVYALRSDVRFTPVLRGNWQYYGQPASRPLGQESHRYETIGT